MKCNVWILWKELKYLLNKQFHSEYLELDFGGRQTFETTKLLSCVVVPNKHSLIDKISNHLVNQWMFNADFDFVGSILVKSNKTDENIELWAPGKYRLYTLRILNTK